jgi:branched-chain amino acid transport system substrate-binding protein
MKNKRSGLLSLVLLVVVAVVLFGCRIVVGGRTPTPALLLPALVPTGGPPSEQPPPSPSQPTQVPTAQPTAKPGLGPEVRIGVVYPLSGRLEQWGKEAVPFIQMAEADINALPESTAAGLRFRFVIRSTETTEEGAMAAVQDLVEKEGIRVIAGLPLSGELEHSISYLTQHHVAVVSSASTGPLPVLRKPDTVFRIAPSELYLARTLAEFALDLGYRKAAVIYRTDGWGDPYAAEIAAAFKSRGYPTALVPIEPTHPYPKDYAAEVAQLSARVAELGADDEMVVFMVVWEGEDLNILHHAAQDTTLSHVRWLAAILYPSLLSGHFVGSELSFPDARDFALAHKMWGEESHPPMNELVRRLWTQAKAQLGEEPRFEHVYLYDALQIAARAVMLAGTAEDGEAVAAAIPAAVEGYNPATGLIRFDNKGDRASGDLAYYGLFQSGAEFEYRYYAYFYYDAAGGRFEVLQEPEPRYIRFCPEC